MRHIPGIAFVDFLANLLVVFVVLFILALVEVQPKATPAALRTPGVYAIVATWSGARDEDVDLYVRDPDGNIVYFENPSAGLLHLEHDDLGFPSATAANGRLVKPPLNEERTVLRGVEPGEFTVNVHLYRQGASGPVPVLVKLYRLIGADTQLISRRVVLRSTGDEQTAFRFTVRANGSAGNFNRLPATFVQRGWQQGT